MSANKTTNEVQLRAIFMLDQNTNYIADNEATKVFRNQIEEGSIGANSIVTFRNDEGLPVISFSMQNVSFIQYVTEEKYQQMMRDRQQEMMKDAKPLPNANVEVVMPPQEGEAPKQNRKQRRRRKQQENKKGE